MYCQYFKKDTKWSYAATKMIQIMMAGENPKKTFGTAEVSHKP